MNWQPGVSLAEVEKRTILAALKFFQGNKTRTAQSLDIAIRTLDNKLELYGRGKEVTPEPNPNQRIGPDTSSGLHVESFKKHAEERSLPMRESKEVQKVPPKRSA